MAAFQPFVNDPAVGRVYLPSTQAKESVAQII
jgi:hypothetical protein